MVRPLSRERAIFENVQIRDLDEDAKRATFVAATETGVRTWNGPEVLRIKGAKLDRFKRNPVILDTHQRDSIKRIIGRSANTGTEKRELLLDIEFADTESGEEAWKLVRTGFVRAISVGFDVLDLKDIRADESDGEGEARVKGPATIITEWELFEASLVPVGADPNALARDIGQTVEQLTANRDAIRSRKMSKDKKRADDEGNPFADDDDEKKKGRADDDGDADDADEERCSACGQTKKKKKKEKRADDDMDDESDAEARAREIRAMAPEALKPLAEDCIIRRLSVDDAETELLAAHRKRHKPLGTPDAGEPKPAPKAAPEGPDIPTDPKEQQRAFVDALHGLSR